ncbi:hypothetical protein [Haloferula rosea]|uniref:Uncharacterized protein n=1 Tax=Haloferula rosea TaxID=490093 RepID=A0A934RFB8_9BACT|nr:hypothetical protein [Haloferula rosea]MBK1828583.1 hypothetical protein [Haloferula rosea]
METYQILFHGHGFKVSIDGEPNSIAGFYTARRVQAQNPDDAYLAALKLLQSEQKTKSLVDESVARGATPKFEAEDIFEVGFWRRLFSRPPIGFVFYDDSDEAADESQEPKSEQASDGDA